MKSIVTLLTLASAARAATFQPLGVPFKAPVTVATGLAAHVIFSNLTAPRGIVFDGNQNLLVVERGLGVTAFTPVTSPSVGWERTIVVKNANLTQGIQVDGSRLLVSTAKDVLVYQYDATTNTVDASLAPYPIVDGLPADGELTTHTLQLETGPNGNTIGLLIASGPATNVDVTAEAAASGRSQIRRFIFPITPTAGVFPPPPLPWSGGQIIAYGIRNPAGFAFSPLPAVSPAATKGLYIVDNGASIGGINGLTPAFANDNPADELELLSFSTDPTVSTPRFYGYPDCATLWNPDADPVGVPQYVGLHRGDQFSLNLTAARDDAWCRNTTNNQPPALSFQAHSVPLDIKFYTTPGADDTITLPTTLSGDAFVSFHGSFDRSPPTGYGVVHVPFPLGALSASALGYSFIVQATDIDSCPGNCIRPVGLAFGKEGRLFVSSDSSGELFVIQRAPLASA